MLERVASTYVLPEVDANIQNVMNSGKGKGKEAAISDNDEEVEGDIIGEMDVILNDNVRGSQ